MPTFESPGSEFELATVVQTDARSPVLRMGDVAYFWTHHRRRTTFADRLVLAACILQK
jgi:hypothetical protein